MHFEIRIQPEEGTYKCVWQPCYLVQESLQLLYLLTAEKELFFLTSLYQHHTLMMLLKSSARLR